MTVARVTQEAIETLSNVTAKVRVTRATVEVLSANSLHMVTGQLAVEVLSPYIPPTDIYPTEIESSEAFGTPTIEAGATISPTEIPSSETFGTPTLLGATIIYPTEIPSEEAFGGDGGASATTVIFSARAFDPYVDNELLYEGSLVDGVITWTKRMDFATVASGYSNPCRVVPHGDGLSIYEYGFDDSDESNLAVRIYDSSAFSAVQVYDYPDWADCPSWEEIAALASGLAAVLHVPGDYGTGYTVRVSTDHGATFSAATNLDYLYTLLGDTVYNNWWDSSEIDCAITADQTTSTLYVLVSYKNNSGGTEWTTYLLSSETGLTWSLVQQWVTLSALQNSVALSVDDGHIAVYFRGNVDSPNLPIRESFDSGANWLTSYLPITKTGSVPVAVSVSGTTTLCLVFATNYSASIYRSVSGGAYTQVWTMASTPVMYPGERTLRSSNGIFALAIGYLYYPKTGYTWSDTTEIPHTLEGVGDPCLCFWVSEDDGLTWSLYSSPIDANNWGSQTLDVLSVTGSGGGPIVTVGEPPDPFTVPLVSKYVAPVERVYDYVQLPLPALGERSITFDSVLYGTRYYVSLTWIDRLASWYASIWTDTENLIIGRRISINIPLMQTDTTRVRPIGDFILIGLDDNDPGQDLTDCAFLYFQVKNAPLELNQPVDQPASLPPSTAFTQLILPSVGERAISFDAIINGTRYFFDVVYAARLDGWYLTLRDDAGLIATGRRMIVGMPMLLTDVAKTLDGNLILIEQTGSNEEPSVDLSNYALVYYE